MAAIPILIGSLRFPSKVAAAEFVRKILYRYAPGERITGEDEDVVRDLFHIHPDHILKLNGHAISHFEVADQPEQHKPTRSFVVVRSDGHRDDFSLKRALKIRK